MPTYAETLKKLMALSPTTANRVNSSETLKNLVAEPPKYTMADVTPTEPMQTEPTQQDWLKQKLSQQPVTQPVAPTPTQTTEQTVQQPVMQEQPQQTVAQPTQQLQAPTYAPVQDNSAMIKAQNQALIDALKAKIQQNIQAKQLQIGQLGQQYDPLRAQSEVRKAQELRMALEQSANLGDRGGIGRQQALETQTAGEQRLNAIDLQQQSDRAKLENDIQNLTLEGNIQEAQYKAQELKDLIAEQNRVNELNYARGTQAEQTAYERQQRADELARQLEQRQYERTQAQTQAESQAQQQAKSDAWNRVNTLGYVDAQSASILGLSEGTVPLEAQKTLQQLQAGDIDNQTAQYKLDELTNPNSVTNQLNKLDMAIKNQDLASKQAEYKEWLRTAPQRAEQTKLEIQKARDAQQLALVQKKIADQELLAKKIETANLTQQQKDEHARTLQSLAESKANIAQAQARLGISQAELDLARKKFTFEKSEAQKAGSSKVNYKDSPDFKSDFALANSTATKDKIYKALITQNGANQAIQKYGTDGYKALLSASAPKNSNTMEILQTILGGE